MQSPAQCLSSPSYGSVRLNPIAWLIALRNSNVLGKIATVLVFAGLTFAIATDGELSVGWTRLLFASLAVLDVLMIDWLIR